MKRLGPLAAISPARAGSATIMPASIFIDSARLEAEDPGVLGLVARRLPVVLSLHGGEEVLASSIP